MFILYVNKYPYQCTPVFGVTYLSIIITMIVILIFSKILHVDHAWQMAPYRVKLHDAYYST